MTTVALQLVVSLLTLVFGALALRVRGAGPHATPARAWAWQLTAAAFLLSGANGVATGLTAAWGWAAGEGTVAMEVAWRLRFVGNESRGLAMVGFAVLLLRRLLPGDEPAPGPFWRAARPLAAWMAVGAALGWAEALDDGRHYEMVAVVSAVAVILLLAALWLAVTRDAMDYLLWVALMAYTVRETFDVSLSSAFAWLEVPGAWMPSFLALHLLAVATYLVMTGCAARRLALARRGVPVPSLFELGGRVPALPPRGGDAPGRT